MSNKDVCSHCPHICNCQAKPPHYGHEKWCAFLQPHTKEINIDESVNWSPELKQILGTIRIRLGSVVADQLVKEIKATLNNFHSQRIEQAYKDGARDMRDYAMSEIVGTAHSLRDRVSEKTSDLIIAFNEKNL